MKVSLQYFKKSGKFYSNGEYTTEHKSFYDIIQEVRGFLAEGKLPDLVDGYKEFDVYIAPNENEYNDQYFPIILKS